MSPDAESQAVVGLVAWRRQLEQIIAEPSAESDAIAADDPYLLALLGLLRVLRSAEAHASSLAEGPDASPASPVALVGKASR